MRNAWSSWDHDVNLGLQAMKHDSLRFNEEVFGNIFAENIFWKLGSMVFRENWRSLIQLVSVCWKGTFIMNIIGSSIKKRCGGIRNLRITELGFGTKILASFMPKLLFARKETVGRG